MSHVWSPFCSQELLCLGRGADGFGSRHIGIVACLRQGQGLHVGVHALRHTLAGGYRVHDRAGAVRAQSMAELPERCFTLRVESAADSS